MKVKLIAVCALLIVTTSALAEEAIPVTNQDELGMDQKLARVYDLYRKGDTVSLKPSEMQMGVGVAYTTSNKETFGLRQSARTLSTQVFASRGIGSGMEVSVSVPYLAQSQRVETSSEALARNELYGIGDPTVRVMKILSTKEVSTTGILSVSLPWGKDELSRRETHTSLGASWSKVLRPAFITGGLTWERDWKSDVNGLGYNAGLGFFLNHALSVGGELSGVAVLNPKMGATRDSMALGLKVAYQTVPDFGVVVLTNFAVATDTPQSTIGVTTYWRF
ncbi:MAG: hypothetical protein Q7K40_00145 [bacterium]|nr:hypothetical protein [bacterium]